MLKPEDEQLVQDYLDDRLPADRRSAFERRSAAEPALADRVADGRALRRALREEPPALSPGFYTRARARFEEANAPPRWMRLMSWEAAGLAAAAVLVLAIFLPPVLQREADVAVPQARRAAGEDMEQTGRSAPSEGAETRPLATEDAPAREASPADEMEGVGATGQDPAVAERFAKDDAKGAVSVERSLPEEQEPAPVLTQERSEPSKKKMESAEKTREPQADSLQDDLYAPAPPLSPSQTDGRPDRTDTDALRQAAPGAELPVEEQESAASAPFARSRTAAGQSAGAEMKSFSRSQPHPVVALPAGIVDPRALRSVVDRGEWEALERGPGGAALSTLGGWREGTRLLLMGPREEGLDCATIEVRVETGLPRVVLTFSGSPVAPPGGCALVLADDGLPLAVEERTR